jgi:hypothetical protein
MSQKLCFKLPLTPEQLKFYLITETVLKRGKITQDQFLKYFFPKGSQAAVKDASDSSDDEQMRKSGSISNIK